MLFRSPDLEDIEITDADRELACQVRRHWLDKLTLQRLQGRTVSSFREKLGAFLVGNRPLYKDEIGMLYHLPYFYFEDLATAELVQSTAAVLPSVPERRDATLTPLKTFSLKRKHGEITQYWWTDPHNRPHCLNIKKDSEHTRLWKSLYNFSSISVNTSVSTKPFMGTDRYYYQIYAVDLLSVA